MELDQFRIIKELLTEIRDLLKEQKEKPTKQLLLEDEQKTFGSAIDEKRCACGNLPHELCSRTNTTGGCLRNIGITII